MRFGVIPERGLPRAESRGLCLLEVEQKCLRDFSLIRQDEKLRKNPIVLLWREIEWEWFLDFLIGNSRAYGGCLG
jgi:hypothetical protein